MAKSPGAPPPRPGGSKGGPKGGPPGPSLPDEVAKLAAAIDALVGATRGVPGAGGPRAAVAGAGLGPRAFSRMTDDEVLARLKTIHGGLPKGFGAESVVRFGGKVDWRATEGLMRQQGRAEQGHERTVVAARSGERDAGDRFAAMVTAGLTRILPTAMARPVADAFRKSREWRDFSDSLGEVARNARAAGMPFSATAASAGRLMAMGGGAAATIAAIPGAAVGATVAAYNLGQRQMAAMTALAPFSPRMLSEFVDLELSRFRRSIALAEGVSATGSGLILSRDFLEHSVLEGQTALNVLKNQVGIMAFGGLGIGAGMLTAGLGLDGGAMDRRMAQVNLGLLRMVGGAPRNAANAMAGQVAQGGMLGAGVGGAGGAIGGALIGGPVGLVLGGLGGLLLGGAGGVAGVGVGQQMFGANALAVGPNPGRAAFEANLKWIEDTAPDMAAALIVPSLLKGIAGALGAFGQFGQAGFEQGVQSAVDEATKQLQAFEAQRGQNHQSWMKAFGAIADEGILADRDARGTTWELGPQGMGNAIVMGDLAPFGRRRDPRRRRRRRRDDD